MVVANATGSIDLDGDSLTYPMNPEWTDATRSISNPTGTTRAGQCA